jgi:predicted TIM-barrel fold metal-dependent hydrolase
VGVRTAVLDGDGHVVERRSDLVRFGWTGPATELIDTLLGWQSREDWGGHIKPQVHNGAFDPIARLGDMDAEGIDQAVNYPTPLLGVSDIPDIASSAAACRAYNDWFAATYRDISPDRLCGIALVPLSDPGVAATEAWRAITNLGAVGVMVQPYVGADRHLCDPPYDSLWATLQELGRPVAVHGSRHTCPPKLTSDAFRNFARFYALSHPFQQMVAMGDLALGGVFERFPRLKVVFLESGVGWMPYFVDRLDEAYISVREDWVDDRWALARKPSEYVRSGNCWFSCEPDEPNLETMVNWLGQDQVIFASDYPHFDGKFPESARSLLNRTDVSDRLLVRIAGTNGRALYGI